jgi:hypothetical protein
MMKLIALVVAALLCGTLAADARQGRSRAAHHTPAPVEASAPADSEESTSEALRRLPNVFRNCEHPAKWFCYRH